MFSLRARPWPVAVLTTSLLAACSGDAKSTPAAPSTPASTAEGRGADGPGEVTLVPLLQQRGGIITNVAFPPGDDLVLVAWKHGVIRWRELASERHGILLELPQYSADTEGVVDVSESGLIGMALHPDFAENGRLFLHYNRRSASERAAVISEWQVRGFPGPDMTAGDERVVLAVPQTSDFHNGGQLVFGPDGMLYVGLGDGEQGEWPVGRSPAETLRGKVLRLDVDRRDNGRGYAIPADNPFVDHARIPPETWAWGVRNPWRLSFLPDGRMIAGDVGEDRCEEVTFIERGGHHGWPYFEGHHERHPWSLDGVTPVSPIYSYEHSVGRSVIGGHFYRGSAIPDLVGHYVFGDLMSGRILALDVDAPRGSDGNVPAHEIASWPMLTTFATDSHGELYVGTHTGQVYRLQEHTGDGEPTMPEVPVIADDVARQMFRTEYDAPGRRRIPDRQIELGRALYADERLSATGDVSCASCHVPARFGQDGLRVSVGAGGVPTTRNTPPTFNAHRQFAQLWDFRGETVEAVVFIKLIREHGFGELAELEAALRAVPAYEQAFREAFPQMPEPVGAAQACMALGAYLRQLSTRSRWDDYLAGDDRALSVAEKRGLSLFVAVGCTVCHQYRGLGGSMPQKLGLLKPWDGADKGRGELEGVENQDYFFKVPPLFNVAETGPYYHDGSIDTLEEAVRNMAAIQLNRQLTDEQVASIVTFLGALTGELAPDGR